MAARYMYAKEVSHQGLNKYRVVKAPTRHELERKVSALQAQWDEQWRKIQEREAKQRNLAQERADKQRDLAEAESYAQSMTAQAERLQEMLDSILKRSLYPQPLQTSVYKGYKQDKIEMRGDRAEMSDFPLYLNTVAGGLDRRDQTIGGFSFVVKIYAVPVVEIIG